MAEFTPTQQQEIRELALQAMSDVGAAVDDDIDVPFIDAEDLEDDSDSYSMPMVKVENNISTYAKVKIADLVEAAADVAAAQHGLMEGVTQAQLDQIFPPAI
jgi:hypothetical protein